MANKYEPRELTDAQKVFQVILETKPGQGAYGFGETEQEAAQNARHFLRRDFGPAQKVERTKVFKWDPAERGGHGGWAKILERPGV